MVCLDWGSNPDLPRSILVHMFTVYSYNFNVILYNKTENNTTLSEQFQNPIDTEIKTIPRTLAILSAGHLFSTVVTHER